MITATREKDTIDLAQRCAQNAQMGDIFAISGPMGAGKSVFCRAFIQHLCGHNIEVPSPTFTLVQTYDSDKGEIWHFDLYRLENVEEIYEIGWEEALDGAILLIEWPERLGHLLPPQRADIHFKNIQGDTRQIELLRHGYDK